MILLEEEVNAKTPRRKDAGGEIVRRTSESVAVEAWWDDELGSP